jgi:hypothetical protein
MPVIVLLSDRKDKSCTIAYVGISRIVDYHRSTKTVTVLGGQMGMIPEGTRLSRGIEVIQERVP